MPDSPLKKARQSVNGLFNTSTGSNYHRPNGSEQLDCAELNGAGGGTVESGTISQGSRSTVLPPVEFLNYVYIESERCVLGEGTFGTVYSGRNKVTGTNVAVKRAPRTQSTTKELNLMRSLDSDHLVRLIDVHMTERTVYVVMELCDTDLDRHLENTKGQALAIHDLSVVLDNVARGYDVLFGERIVHRDLKPANILVSYAASPAADGGGGEHIRAAKITDFGACLVWQAQDDDDTHGGRALLQPTEADDEQDEDETRLGALAGSFYYMAPEVGANLVQAHHYDWRVDMWSIGVVLFQCISGQLPFSEQCLCRLFLHAAAGHDDRGYRKPLLPPSSSEEHKSLVDKLLQFDASKRLDPVRFYEAATEWRGAEQ